MRLCAPLTAFAIFFTTSNGRAECLKLLLDAGSDGNKCNNDGASLIYFAASNGHADCLKLQVRVLQHL